MLTLAIDEAGEFEAKTDPSTRWRQPLTMIGGILYDDLDLPDERENERKRVEAYYKAVIHTVNQNENLGAEYPEDLHYKKKGDNSKVASVKKVISNSLPDFMKEGKYQGRELQDPSGSPMPGRRGKYYICAIVKSKCGKSALLRNELGDFFKDGIASNVYYHMMSEVPQHFIFCNPFYPDNNVFHLDIATRMSGDVESTEIRDEYEAQGFEDRGLRSNNTNPAFSQIGNKSQPDPTNYSLMNADIFRSILSEQMIQHGNRSIQIDTFRVMSISYSKKNQSVKKGKMTFLHLADTICSYLTYGVKAYDLDEVMMRATGLTGDDVLVFSYDDVDEYLKKSIEYVETGKYYEALSALYQLIIKDTSESRLYKEKWIPYIEEEIIRRVEYDRRSGERSSGIYEAVQKLRESYGSNRLNPEEGFFIFQVLLKACLRLKDHERNEALMYYIHDVGVKAYCHKGDPYRAEKYYHTCIRYATAVNMDDYMKMRNQYATSLCDAFEYEKAVDCIRTTVELLQGINTVFLKVMKNDQYEFGMRNLAKTYSLAGQCASFLGDTESARIYYEEALRMMHENSRDEKITESYYLHMLIDAADQDAYQTWMEMYCGGNDSPIGQLLAIQSMADNGLVNKRYAYYLYVKGLYRFGDVDQKVWDAVKLMERKMDKKEKQGHPWEMTYKYLCLLAMKMGDTKESDRYYKMIHDAVSSEEEEPTPIDLVSLISMCSRARIHHERSELEKENALYYEIYDALRTGYPGLMLPEDIDLRHKKELIKQRFRFMYH